MGNLIAPGPYLIYVASFGVSIRDAKFVKPPWELALISFPEFFPAWPRLVRSPEPGIVRVSSANEPNRSELKALPHSESAGYEYQAVTRTNLRELKIVDLRSVCVRFPTSVSSPACCQHWRDTKTARYADASVETPWLKRPDRFLAFSKSHPPTSSRRLITCSVSL